MDVVINTEPPYKRTGSGSHQCKGIWNVLNVNKLEKDKKVRNYTTIPIVSRLKQ